MFSLVSFKMSFSSKPCPLNRASTILYWLKIWVIYPPNVPGVDQHWIISKSAKRTIKVKIPWSWAGAQLNWVSYICSLHKYPIKQPTAKPWKAGDPILGHLAILFQGPITSCDPTFARGGTSKPFKHSKKPWKVLIDSLASLYEPL